MAQRYWLAMHAYPATVGPQTIFFDSKQRTFCALRTDWVYSLRAVIEDWSMPETPYAADNEGVSVDECAAYLAERKLLTTVASEGKRMQQLHVTPVQHALVDHADMLRARIGPMKALRIAYSAVRATRRFRRRTFDDLLQQRAQQRRMHNDEKPRVPEQHVLRLVAAYWRMRPLLPFDRYTDLVDSLALTEYLSGYRVFPKLVIGVQLMPFASHTWVQEQETVFNDVPEFVRQFTPIFSA